MEGKAKSSHDIDIDSYQLRKVLESISNQLTVPFLEKRGRNNMHKNNPLDELRDVIQELTERERELQACIGIAKMLLDNNDTIHSKLKEYKEKNSKQKEKTRQISFELNRYKEEIINSEEKYEQVNTALIKCEEQLLIITAENRRVLNESCKLKELPDSLRISVQNYESEIEELKSTFRAQFDDIHRGKFELERKLKKSLEEKTNYEAQISDLKEKILKLEHKHLKTTQRFKDVECELMKFKQGKDETDRKCEVLMIKLEKTRSQNEKLEEDLSILENMQISGKHRVRRQSRNLSLLNELENIHQNEDSDYENIENGVEERPSPLPTKASLAKEKLLLDDINTRSGISISTKDKSMLRPQAFNYIIDVLDGINIEAKLNKISRKDPAEEYFTLVIIT